MKLKQAMSLAKLDGQRWVFVDPSNLAIYASYNKPMLKMSGWAMMGGAIIFCGSYTGSKSWTDTLRRVRYEHSLPR